VFVFLSQRRFRHVPKRERRRRRCTRSDAFAKASRSRERLCSPWTSSPSPPPPPPPPPTSSRASPCRAGGTSASARARTPCRRNGGGLRVRAETGRYGRTGQFSARMSKGKRFGWFRVKNLHTARPTVTLRCGTEATYPLRWRSRTPARRGPAGRCPARHPAVAGSKTRRRSRRRSREVRQIPRVFRPRFARDLVVAFVPSRMSRTPRPRGSRSRDDPSPTHLLVPRQQRRLVAVRGQGRVVPRSAPREGHLAVLAARPFSDDEVAVFTAENLAPISSLGPARRARRRRARSWIP